MNWIMAFAILRIVAYAFMATRALVDRRWWVWATFTALVGSTYIYAFTTFSGFVVELIRTIVASGLIYITLRRK